MNPLKTQQQQTKLSLNSQNEQIAGSYEVNLSAEFQDLEETKQTLKESTEKPQNKIQPQSQEPQIKHFIVPRSMFEGQFEYVTKQKKKQDVQEQLNELENQKRQLQISTQHYVNPLTVVEAQVENVGKLNKEQQVQKQLTEITNEQNTNKQQNRELQEMNEKEHKVSQQHNKSQNTKISSNNEISQDEKPKVLHRVNLHEFNSNEVPQLHQQEIPVNLLPPEEDQLKSNIFSTNEKTIKSIKLLEPVNLQTKKKKDDSNFPNLPPVSLQKPLDQLQKYKQQIQNKKSKKENEQKHYIIPGTCYEGQFQYITKEKKEEDVQKQLQQLEKQKRQIEINTQHYINPTTVVQGQIPNAIKQQKPEFKNQSKLQQPIRSKQLPQIHQNKQGQQPSHKAKQGQKKVVSQRKLKQIQNNKQNELKIPSKVHKYRQSDRNAFMKNELSQADTEGLKLLKQRSKDQKYIKMEIRSEQEEKLPYKIDQYTCMTVLSPEQQENPSLNFPFSEEPNDDLEIIVMQTSLNKQATSPKDLVNERPRDVLGNDKMQSVIQGINNSDGSPMKVVIGTKQFANYPGQSAPSPPIIDETTLSDFRKKNNSQFLQKNNPNFKHQANANLDQNMNTQFSTKVQSFRIDSQRNAQGNPKQVQLCKVQEEKTSQLIKNGKNGLEVQHFHVTLDIDKIKKTDQNNQKPKRFLPKLIKSVLFSSLVGGLAWLSLEDKKITAIAAATGFTFALLIQRQ